MNPPTPPAMNTSTFSSTLEAVVDTTETEIRLVTFPPDTLDFETTDVTG